MQIPRVANEVLQQTADVLESLHIPYWIDSGTLLSAYRDQNINHLDHDIDLRCFSDKVDEAKTAELVKGLWLAGFHHIEANKPIKAQILALHQQRILLDFKFCHIKDNLLWYYCWADPYPQPLFHVFPTRFFEKLGKIELLGREYPCPQPIEEYIIRHYGPDWRKFKVRASEANVTDLSWDYMHDSPACMTQGQLDRMLGNNELQEAVLDE